MSRRRLLTIALTLMACSAPPPLDLLGGERADTERLIFSADMPPVLRFDAAPAHLSVVWQGESRTTLVVQTSTHGRRVIVRAEHPNPHAEDATLEVRTDAHTWRIPARWVATEKTHPDLTALRALPKTRATLQRVDAELDTAQPTLRPWLLAWRSRVARQVTGREDAADSMRRAAEAAVALGWRSRAAQFYRRAATAARQAERFEDAERLLDAARAAWPHPITAAYDEWFRGLIERDRGRIVRARRHFIASAQRMQAIGRRDIAVQLDQNVEEMVLDTGGRWQPLPAAPDDWIQTSGREWLDYLAMRRCARSPDYAGLARRMSASIDRFVDDDLAPAFRANFFVNRALAHEAAGALDAARVDAARAREHDPAGGLEPLTLARLEARLLQPVDPEAARQRFSALGASLRQKGYGIAHRWRVLSELGDALQATGRADAAVDAWQAALATLEVAGRDLALDATRSNFHADRGHVVEAVVAAQRHRPAAAFMTAASHGAPVGRLLAQIARVSRMDAARLRALRSATTAVRTAEADVRSAALADRPAAERALIAAKARRQAMHQAVVESPGAEPDFVSADAVLRALEPDEALVLLQPVRSQECTVRWRRFWLEAGEVAITGGRVDPAGGLPATGARHVYLVGGSPQLQDRFERMVGEQGATLSRLPTASHLLQRSAPASGPPLVFGDPGDDLIEARAEARWLVQRGVTGRIGQDATRAAFDMGTATARWVHFAGHGVRSADPFETHLRLADGPMTLTDILATRRPVRTAILAGCETARSEPLSHLESLGLAEAFVLAGTRSVVAADYTVPDDDAGRFSRLFHLRDGPERPAEALREVRWMMALADDVAADGWHLFGAR